MSQPPKAIACLKCNAINFQLDNCKRCGEALTVVGPDKNSDNPQQPTEEQVKNKVTEEVVEQIETENLGSSNNIPAAEKPESFASRLAASRPVDKELNRRKLQAKLRDAKMNRAKINAQTEVLDKKGRRINGARRIPVTVTQPMSTPESPFSRA